jgi:hypothetical protein
MLLPLLLLVLLLLLVVVCVLTVRGPWCRLLPRISEHGTLSWMYSGMAARCPGHCGVQTPTGC